MTRARDRTVNFAVLAAASAGSVALYLWTYLHHPRRPAGPGFDQGWWDAFDQLRYLRSTLAWAAGNLDPAQHWYLPGYPLLGAPFVHVTPANPFLIPNLVSMLAALWLMAALAGRLAPNWRFAPSLGGASFVAAAVLPPSALDVWIVPWTTTPSTPLTLACLLGAIVFIGRLPEGRLAWPAFAVTFCGGAVASFRPADAAVLLCVTSLVLAAAMLRRLPSERAFGAAVLAGAGGLAVAVSLLVVPYLAVSGWRLSPYVQGSSGSGFDWQLIPIRWVTIMLSPRPLLPDGMGLLQVYPWVLAGFAGAAACLIAPPGGGRRTLHAVVLLAAGAQIALYLAYRELHPPGLWAYANQHYFKWVLAPSALYAALLAGTLAERRWRAALAGVAGALVLLPWRVELAAGAASPAPQTVDGALVLAPARLGVYDVLLAPATGDPLEISSGSFELRVGDRVFNQLNDFKPLPIPGGFMVTMLRSLPDGPIRLSTAPGVVLATDTAPRLTRQRIVFGQDCWLAARIPACRFGMPIPPPPLAVGTTLHFGPGPERYLREGWTYFNPPDGRWTDGPRAAVSFILSPPAAGPLALTVEGGILTAPGLPPLRVRMLAGGTVIGSWQLDSAAPVVLQAPLPPGFGADGQPVTVALEFANPRVPSEITPDNKDNRRLGLFVRSMTVRPAG